MPNLVGLGLHLPPGLPMDEKAKMPEPAPNTMQNDFLQLKDI